MFENLTHNNPELLVKYWNSVQFAMFAIWISTIYTNLTKPPVNLQVDKPEKIVAQQGFEPRNGFLLNVLKHSGSVVFFTQS